MIIKAGQATYQIKNIPPGTYPINIEFRYQTQEYGSVMLVQATQSVTITEGGTTLAFNEESYLDRYLDNDTDNDNISNYKELKNGTNLNEIEDEDPPLTDALINNGKVTVSTGISYIGPQKVTLQCTEQISVFSSGCLKSYYTTDKSDPKTSATRIEYNSSILIEENTTLKYYSVDYVGNEEPFSSTIELIILPSDSSPPKTTLDPPPGTYSGSIGVTTDCTDTGGSGCDRFYYTRDGSDPENSETRKTHLISDPKVITISETTTLKFYSVDANGNKEITRTAEYEITGSPKSVIATLNRSIQAPTKPYIAAETYTVNFDNTINSFSAIHPSGKFAYRIENNKVLGFQLKPGSIIPMLELTTQYTPASIVLHPSGKFAYIASNKKSSGSITVYDINQKTGIWSKTATAIDALPVNAKIITVTPDGNFLYLLSNQNIMAYNINPETGKITESANQHTVLTATPDAALISQSGEQLYIRNQALNMVEKYTIDIPTGALDGPIKQLPLNGAIPQTMLILDKSFYLIDTHYPLFTKTVDNYVETFW